MNDPLTLIHGDALSSLRTMESESVQTCVTSPPYWGLRDYGHEFQIGLEKTPEEYVARLVEVFAEVKRVLRKDGTLWLNLGDSYGGGTLAHRPPGNASVGGWSSEANQINRNGFAAKQLIGVPWRMAFALQSDGWYLRSDIVWAKPNPMPESVTDRPTRSHEYIFLLSKSPRYYYDADAIKEPARQTSVERLGRAVSDTHRWVDGAPGQPPHAMHQSRPNAKRGHASGEVVPYGDPKKSQQRHGEAIKGAKFGGNKAEGYGTRKHSGNEDQGRYIENGVNKRSVWTVSTKPFSEAHFATFPEDLIVPCILAGAPVGAVVLDPFAGSGTTGKVAIELGRKAILIEPKAEYVEMIKRRCQTTIGLPLIA